ncbi:MAG: CRISPR-associated endonuclease Cas1 [Polyangiaceae bacterium]|nr:CRISPR-associated endonuclease Cas1 [Polyangiaceae bacterium]
MERKTIYVTRQGAKLQRVDGQLGVYIDRTLLDRFAPNEIDQVLLFGNVQVSTQAISLLFKHGVHVSFFSTSARYRGQLVAPESGNVFVRLAQHARYMDAAFRLELSRALIRSKIGAGRLLVRRFARNHPAAAEVMDECAQFLAASVDALDGVRDWMRCEASRELRQRDIFKHST